MIDTNTIPQIAANVAVVHDQLAPYLPGAGRGRWLGGPRDFYFQPLGFQCGDVCHRARGIGKIIQKLIWNPEAGK
jgi:hypothetical protein